MGQGNSEEITAATEECDKTTAQSYKSAKDECDSTLVCRKTQVVQLRRPEYFFKRDAIRKREIDVEGRWQHVICELLGDAGDKLVAGEHAAVLGTGNG
jgi:hypothetical protein